MVKVTVITPTYRETSQIVAQAMWLEHQTMVKEDFEWIILDDLYEQRHEEVARLATSYRIKHLPSGVDSPYKRPSEAINRGLVRADGELVHFMNDYIELTPQLLERHWELYQAYGPRVVIGGPLISARCPRCVEASGESWQDVFPNENTLMILCIECRLPMFYHRARVYEVGLNAFEGETWNPHLARLGFWAGRNDSAPLECLLDVNGLDESLDNRGGDHDLITRLLNLGCRKVTDFCVPAIIHAHTRTKGRPPELEEALVPGNPQWGAVLSGEVWAPNGWSIREARQT